MERETPTLRTTIVTYRYWLENPEERAEYEEMCARLKKDGLKKFPILSFQRDKKFKVVPGYVRLETNYIFSNQWNSETQRLMDWSETVFPNKNVKEGYYLKQTKKMRAIRKNTLVCGYCGKYEMVGCGKEFCDKCLDHEYLKEKDLFLLRLKPVAKHRPKRPPLTEEEHASLMPVYTERQTTGATSRNAAKLRKQRKDIEAKRNKGIIALDTEADGKLWLMDNNISVDNVIYYTHTDTFSFGWRSPVSEAVKAKIESVLKGKSFPFKYEFKTSQDGSRAAA
jgi:hypothetical protein